MPLRRVLLGFGLVLLGVPPLPAADVQTASPVLVLQVRSLDALAARFKFLIEQVTGQAELANQLEGLVKARFGADDLEGIDPTRPWGLYADPSDDLPGFQMVFLIPVRKEKAFLDLLDQLNIQVKKDKNGLYRLEGEQLPPGIPIGFRLAHGYIYLSALNLAALAPKQLVPPDRVFAARPQADLALTFRLDRLPQTAKDTVLTAVEAKLAELKEQAMPDETPAQQKVRAAVLDLLVQGFRRLLDEGRALELQLNVQEQRRQLSVALQLDARPGSPLAEELRRFGQQQSLFANLLRKGENTVLEVLGCLTLPEQLRTPLLQAVEEELQQAQQKAKSQEEQQTLREVHRLLKPNLQAGQVDGFLSLRHAPGNKHYTALLGLRVQNGRQLDKALRAAVARMSEKEQAAIHLDAGKVGDTPLHCIDGASRYDSKTRAFLGDAPICLAIRPDALLLAIGEGGRALLEEAVKSPPGNAAPLVLRFSMKELMPLAAKNKTERRIAHKVFSSEPGWLELTLHSGQTLRLELNMDLSVLRFGFQAGQSKKGSREQEP
jgi:hypothetical protein